MSPGYQGACAGADASKAVSADSMPAGEYPSIARNPREYGREARAPAYFRRIGGGLCTASAQTRRCFAGGYGRRAPGRSQRPLAKPCGPPSRTGSRLAGARATNGQRMVFLSPRCTGHGMAGLRTGSRYNHNLMLLGFRCVGASASLSGSAAHCSQYCEASLAPLHAGKATCARRAHPYPCTASRQGPAQGRTAARGIVAASSAARGKWALAAGYCL